MCRKCVSFIIFQIIIVDQLMCTTRDKRRLISTSVFYRPTSASGRDWDIVSFRINHYANMSVQYTAIFHGCKNDNLQINSFNIFLIFAQNIDCGYALERVPTIYVLEQK